MRDIGPATQDLHGRLTEAMAAVIGAHLLKLWFNRAFVQRWINLAIGLPSLLLCNL